MDTIHTCRKFNKTIEILQGDIETLETDKSEMEKKLDQQTRKSMMPDITGRRYGSRGSPFASPFGSPFISRRVSGRVITDVGDAAAEGGEAAAGTGGDQQSATLQNPLLLARVRRRDHLLYITNDCGILNKGKKCHQDIIYSLCHCVCNLFVVCCCLSW